MKVLILGAKGNLGGRLVDVYSDHEVVAWDRDECDVMDADDARDKITNLKPDLVFNCVAFNNVDGAETDQGQLAYELNARVPGELASLTDELGIPFVHYSTGYVFKGDDADGYDETRETDPQNVYATTKRDGELEVLKHSNSYVIRLNWLFGPKAQSEGAKPSFVDMMLGLAQDRDHLDLVDHESASPTYSHDLALRSREIVENMPAGVYHSANTGSCTWKELAEEAFKIKGVSIDITPISGARFMRPANRPRYSELLCTKMAPLRPWQEALKDYLQS